MLTEHLQFTKEFRTCPFSSMSRSGRNYVIGFCPSPSGKYHRSWWQRKGHPPHHAGQLDACQRSVGDASACSPHAHHSRKLGLCSPSTQSLNFKETSLEGIVLLACLTCLSIWNQFYLWIQGWSKPFSLFGEHIWQCTGFFFLALHWGITPVSTQGIIWVLEIKSRSASCKVSVLSTVLFL